MDIDLELDACLSRTTIDAAAAGLHLLDFITGLNRGITWSLHRGRIDFAAERPFCTLRPAKNHISCQLPGLRTAVRLTSLYDIDTSLQNQIRQAYQHAQRH
ncbi:MAG: hypothetical protein H6654_05665 [Ardenticatenaceae bacterium]|nr:hypothetical protein [Anaerolineales bacterium]MCB8941914.1 hypothetical protein [Ardenticatenaceae bacterium]MCB8973028.1 hypothetical protein [Ardenticatenaceae bacterium]